MPEQRWYMVPETISYEYRFQCSCGRRYFSMRDILESGDKVDIRPWFVPVTGIHVSNLMIVNPSDRSKLFGIAD